MGTALSTVGAGRVPRSRARGWASSPGKGLIGWSASATASARPAPRWPRSSSPTSARPAPSSPASRPGSELFGVSRYVERPARRAAIVRCWCCAAASTASSTSCWRSTVFLAYVVVGGAGPTGLGGGRFTAWSCRACPSTRAAIAIVTATVGTTLAPWGLAFIQSYAVDKRLTHRGPALRAGRRGHGRRPDGRHRVLRRRGVRGHPAPRRPAHPGRCRRRRGAGAPGRGRGVDAVRHRPDRRGVSGRLRTAAVDGLLGV